MRELVLTGHKDIWPVMEEQALFLSQQCFCYNQKYGFLEQEKFKIAPSPWKNPQDILDASLYVDDLYDRIIPKLTIIMNELYGLSYSERFWNAYMITWLNNWLGVVYDRYRRLEHVGESFKERFLVKIIAKDLPVAKDVSDFMEKNMKSHSYNQILMSDIIKHAQFDFLNYEKISDLSEEQTGNRNISFTKRVKKTMTLSKNRVEDYLNRFFTNSMYLGLIYGISLKDKIYLQFYRDWAFLFRKRIDLAKKAVRIKRTELNAAHLEFGAKNRFERIIEKIMLKHVPDNLLATYEFKGKIAPRIKIGIGMDIYTSLVGRSEIAFILEKGGRWISAQHGGSYGQALSFPLGKIEYEATGGFITWGWKYKHIYDSNYYALSSPMLSKLKKHEEREDSMIFVGNMLPAYVYRLNNYLAPEQIKDYLRNKMLFLEHLEQGVLNKLKYRPYFDDYGTKEMEYVGEILPKNQFLIKGKLTDFFPRIRLAVIDHPTTTFLQSLVMNTPTILYWDPAQFIFCKDASPFFDRLRDAGILFDRPEAAAKKVNEVWPDVKSWWDNPDRQCVKDDFCFRFARASVNWRSEWAQFLKGL